MAERIGDFLIRIGAMTREQVDEVLRAQGEDDEDHLRMFGEIAVEKGYIDDEALRKFVEQRAAGG